MKIMRLNELFKYVDNQEKYVDNQEIIDILIYRDFEDLIDDNDLSYGGFFKFSDDLFNVLGNYNVIVLQGGLSKTYVMIYIRYRFDIRDIVKDSLHKYSKSLEHIGYILEERDEIRSGSGYFYTGKIYLK